MILLGELRENLHQEVAVVAFRSKISQDLASSSENGSDLVDLYGFFVKIGLLNAERIEPVETVSLIMLPGLLQRLPTVSIDVGALFINRDGLAKRRVAVVV